MKKGATRKAQGHTALLYQKEAQIVYQNVYTLNSISKSHTYTKHLLSKEKTLGFVSKK